jgi:hypothetical protein
VGLIGAAVVGLVVVIGIAWNHSSPSKPTVASPSSAPVVASSSSAPVVASDTLCPVNLRITPSDAAPNATLNVDGQSAPINGLQLKSGFHTIQISAPNYETMSESIQVSPPGTNEFNVTLSPISSQSSGAGESSDATPSQTPTPKVHKKPPEPSSEPVDVTLHDHGYGTASEAPLYFLSSATKQPVGDWVHLQNRPEYAADGNYEMRFGPGRWVFIRYGHNPWYYGIQVKKRMTVDVMLRQVDIENDHPILPVLLDPATGKSRDGVIGQLDSTPDDDD